MSIIGVLAFVLALLISVMIHEAGHYLTAKKFGMKVTEFFIGFGKKLFRTLIKSDFSPAIAYIAKGRRGV